MVLFWILFLLPPVVVFGVGVKEWIKERDGFSVAFAVVFPLLIGFVSFMIAAVVSLGGGELVATRGAECVELSSETTELVPIAKSYYIYFDSNDETDSYRYGVPTENGIRVEHIMDNQRTHIQYTDGDVPSTLRARSLRFKNPVLAFLFWAPTEYYFTVPEGSVFNLGVPVL